MDPRTAVGAEATLHAAQQAAMMGGLDFVLLHPAFLEDYNFVTSIKAQTGHLVCAFGWMPFGTERERIEAAPIDGYLVRMNVFYDGECHICGIFLPASASILYDVIFM